MHSPYTNLAGISGFLVHFWILETSLHGIARNYKILFSLSTKDNTQGPSYAALRKSYDSRREQNKTFKKQKISCKSSSQCSGETEWWHFGKATDCGTWCSNRGVVARPLVKFRPSLQTVFRLPIPTIEKTRSQFSKLFSYFKQQKLRNLG